MKFSYRKVSRSIVPVVLATAMAVFLSGCGAEVQFGDSAPGEEAAGEAGAPVVAMETTMGNLRLELDADGAPITAANFLRYVDDGFYNGTIFHQVVRDSLIIGGSHNSRLERKTEGLHEPIPSEWTPAMKNERGTVGLRRRPGEPASGQAEFYINLQDNPRLDRPEDGKGYVVFGRVTEGMDVVDRIGATQLKPHPANPSGPMTVPIVPVVITGADLVNEVDIAALEAEGAERLAEIDQEKEAAVKEIIEKTREEFGVEFTTTESGLRYATLREGDGPTPPSSTSTVKVHYVGTLTNGKKFDSSYDRNAPATFPLNRVIPGWTEGVGSMKVGEKRRLIIPSDLGYGDRGAPPDIPGGATLVFDVELLEIL